MSKYISDIPKECELAEIICDGIVHDTLPRKSRKVIESAYLIATGQAPAYTIKETTKPHDFDKKSFEESGSNIYYYHCFQCGIDVSVEQYKKWLGGDKS